MKGGQQYGPVETEALLGMLRDGTLPPDTTVLKEGALDWVAARNVPELAAATQPPAAGVPPVAGGGGGVDPADVEKNKIFAVLAYIGILFLVPLLAAKDSKFARYHTNQGVILFLCAVAGWIVAMVLSFIPFVGCLAWPTVAICLLVFMVMGIINAAGGQCKPLPLIGQFTLIK